jgi:hypothetical protein
MDVTVKKPRAVVVFENGAEFQEFENYAKSKSLDIKTFLKFAGRTYMDKYPRSLGRPNRAVQP